MLVLNGGTVKSILGDLTFSQMVGVGVKGIRGFKILFFNLADVIFQIIFFEIEVVFLGGGGIEADLTDKRLILELIFASEEYFRHISRPDKRLAGRLLEWEGRLLGGWVNLVILDEIFILLLHH